MLFPSKPIGGCGCDDCCPPLTKDDVGLGNVDNTSDLNKPISTAMQQALNGKTNESNFIALKNRVLAVEYRVTNIENQAGLSPVFTERFELLEAEVAGIILNKADKTEVYNKTEIDAFLAGKADKATTVAGYGIVDVYTKTQIDGFLANKADKATTLAGYGITDGVTLDTQQDITGEKRIRRTGSMMDFINNNSEYNVVPASNLRSALYYLDKNAQLEGAMEWEKQTDGSHSWAINLRNKNGNWLGRTFKIFKLDNEDEYAVCPVRTYDSGNTTDIVTIGSLASNPNVVHTTGNESMGGIKTLDNVLLRKTSAIPADFQPASDIWMNIYNITDSNGTEIMQFYLYISTAGNTYIRARRKVNGAWQNHVNVATLP